MKLHITVTIRIANPLHIAFVFTSMFKQNLNMETVRFIFTSNRHLTSYGREEQEMHVVREKSLISSSKLNLMTIHSKVCYICTHIFNHRNSLSFLNAILEERVSTHRNAIGMLGRFWTHSHEMLVCGKSGASPISICIL
jgi:hypothetical protein